MRRFGRRLAWPLFAVAVTAAIATPLLTALGVPVEGNHPLEVAGWSAGVVGLLVSVVTLAVTVRPVSRRAEEHDDGHALESFATEVGRQWRTEAHTRRLPLGVTDELHVTWSDGQTDGTVDDLVRRAVEAPVPRLAVLGTAGSGKTSLLVLFTVGLIQQRTDGQPAPLMISATDWAPDQEPFDTWLTRRLRQYATFTASPTAARNLVRDRRILPIMDGLDEAPPELRRRILRELAELPGDVPFVIACRTREFHAAAGSPRPDGLTEVELRQLTVDNAISYLAGRCHWDGEAVEAVRADAERIRPDGPLASALTSPLLVHLTMTLCRSGHLDVAALTDPQRFRTAADLSDHLLATYVPAVFANHADRLLTTEDETPGGPLPGRRRPASAHRWLTRLAVDLTSNGRTEYRWWGDEKTTESHPKMKVATWRWPGWRPLTRLLLPIASLLIGIPAVLVLGRSWIAENHTTWPGRIGELAHDYVRLDFRPIDPQQPLLADTLIMLIKGMGGPEVTALILGTVTVIAIAVAQVLNFKVLADTDTALHPDELYRTNRRVVFRRATLAGTVAALLPVALVYPSQRATEYSIAIGYIRPRPPAELGQVVLGTAIGSALYFTLAFTGFALFNSWTGYVIGGLFRAAARRQPVFMMPFLADAARLGVLRSTGAGYQFRHIRLQHSLAHTWTTEHGRSPHQRLAALLAADPDEAAAALAEGNTASVRARLVEELIRRDRISQGIRLFREARAYGDPDVVAHFGTAMRRRIRATGNPLTRRLRGERTVNALGDALRAGETTAWPQIVAAVHDQRLWPPEILNQMQAAFEAARAGGLPHLYTHTADALDSLIAGTPKRRQTRLRASARRMRAAAAQRGEPGAQPAPEQTRTSA